MDISTLLINTVIHEDLFQVMYTLKVCDTLNVSCSKFGWSPSQLELGAFCNGDFLYIFA